jgi:NAD-dependent SIR2 family protein deacetylase
MRVVEEKNSALCVRCPFCDSKTKTKVYPETVLLNFPPYCPKCKREMRVNVVQQKMVISDEQSLLPIER